MINLSAPQFIPLSSGDDSTSCIDSSVSVS